MPESARGITPLARWNRLPSVTRDPSTRTVTGSQAAGRPEPRRALLQESGRPFPRLFHATTAFRSSLKYAVSRT